MAVAEPEGQANVAPAVAPWVAGPALRGAADLFEKVERIVVLRGGGLGDLLFALPALEALAAAYPQAEMTLLGMPLHVALLTGRPGPVSEVLELPVTPGVRDMVGREDPAALSAFFDRMRARRFDLAVQVHGGGRFSNPFLGRLGARHSVGLRTPDAAPLERTVPYVYYQHEVVRALEVVSLAGASPVTLEPRILVMDRDRDAAVEMRMRGVDALVVVHPGATDPRRRWPEDRFAAVVSRLAESGVQVVLIGDESDRARAEAIVASSGARSGAAGRLVSSAAGKLTMSELVGLLSISDAFLGNDSGPRHLAEAVGTPTVSIFWLGNVITAAPLVRSWHRVHFSWVTNCPVCGRDVTQVGWTAERCDHDPSLVADVAPGPVYDDLVSLLTSAGERGRRSPHPSG